MSENFNINGYTCATGSIYETLKSANLTSSDLKTLDKNSDNKISEDELMEFVEDESTSSAKTGSDELSDDPTIRTLQKKYKKEMKDLYRYQSKLSKLRTMRSEAKANLAGLEEDSSARSDAEARVEEIQSKMDSMNSSITKCIQNMFSINLEIINAQNNLNNNNSISSTQTDGTVNAASQTTGTTETLQVQQGSGSNLASVSGDLSICLDRVAQSLGTTRQNAADYITTLCNTVGKGYFNPKVILSQIFSESSGNQSCSTTSTSKYVGLGQMSAVAVQEVNNQFGTNFTFNDMNDASKNLKAMVYLMRYQYERYGKNLGAALTAYNVGHYSGTVNNYAQKIMSRV